jgi:hypothetical protein
MVLPLLLYRAADHSRADWRCPAQCCNAGQIKAWPRRQVEATAKARGRDKAIASTHMGVVYGSFSRYALAVVLYSRTQIIALSN